MSQTLHAIPAATVTHTTAVIHVDVTSDIAVYHARATDARISLTFETTLMSLYSADATQGLLEAFATARGAMARVPRLIAAPATPPYAPFARTTLSIVSGEQLSSRLSSEVSSIQCGFQVHCAALHRRPFGARRHRFIFARTYAASRAYLLGGGLAYVARWGIRVADGPGQRAEQRRQLAAIRAGRGHAAIGFDACGPARPDEKTQAPHEGSHLGDGKRDAACNTLG
ncbi:MAG: hypothetical protein QOJ24_3968 [Mycobacterium sp.]|jgi:hypothetical protein|nr:hypothetical protein [Mycobacterium sp.]